MLNENRNRTGLKFGYPDGYYRFQYPPLYSTPSSATAALDLEIEKEMPKSRGENNKGIPDLIKNPKGMTSFPETSFKEWLEENTVSENWPSIRKAALAGSLGLALLPFSAQAREVPKNDPGTIKVMEKAKDQNTYYDPSTMKKLVRLANEGDEWAIREIAWPESHPLHKKGRPFFKNTKPHPKGLIKHSGY